MTPAALNRAWYEGGDLASIADTHLHRVWRERGGVVTKGRDDVIADVADDLAVGGALVIAADLPEVVALTLGGVRRHHWVAHEGDWIAREIIVEDGAILTPTKVFGELRSGAGQRAAGVLDGHGALAAALHRLWNARALGDIATLYAPDVRWTGPDDARDPRIFWSEFAARHPASWLVPDRLTVHGDHHAQLWRGAAQRPDGSRVRLLVSSVVRLEDEQVTEEDLLVEAG